MPPPAIFFITGASGSDKTTLYLRGQADALDVAILDTTTLTLADACQALAEHIRRFAAD